MINNCLKGGKRKVLIESRWCLSKSLYRKQLIEDLIRMLGTGKEISHPIRVSVLWNYGLTNQ